jgi:hypothetical protein
MQFRFRISELLFVTAAIAAGCAIAQITTLAWSFGALVTAIILSIPLIVRESVALNRAARFSTAASRDERFELRFLAWGRLLALLILVAAVGWQLLEAAELIASIANDDAFELHDPGPRGRSALLYMSLLVCITSPTLLAPLRRSNVWKLFIDVAAIAAAIALATIILWNDTFIEALVYIAIRGVEQAEPTGALPPGREIQFAYTFLAGTAAAIVVVILSNRAITRWWERQRLRVALLFATAAAGGALAWLGAWLTNTVLPQLSPAMHETIGLGPLYRWLPTVVLIVLASYTWTYLVIRRSRSCDKLTIVPVPIAGYTRVAVPAVIIVALTALGLAAFYETYQLIFRMLPAKGGGTIASGNWQDVLWMLALTENFLPFAAWLLACLLLFRAWKTRRTEPAVQTYGLPPGKFATLLCLNLLLISVTGFLAAWASFALWLTPWYRWVPQITW